jgi:hypothetical protein
MKSDIERRFFLAEGISHQPNDHIDKEVEWAAMARMLDLRDVFQLIVDSLADATLAATPHRVRNEGSGDRLSLPFFFDPNWNSTLEPIDRESLPAKDLASVDDEVRERWDGLDLKKLSRKMTYGDFVWSKVKKVFPDLA